MSMRQGGACERDNRYGGYNGEYARSRSPAHNGSCCWQYWTLHLDLSRRTHYATIICYAARMNELAVDREAIAYHGKRLEYFTIAWNSLEGLIGIGAGVIAGSISLVGFGIDSLIEVTSGATLLWRMSADANVERRGQNERLSLRIVGGCFLALAAYVTYEAVLVLIWRSAPQHSIPGIVLACVSLIVMPILSRAKKRVGNALGSAAMHADARQTDFCVYLSAILLVGLLLNAILGWWWADPIAALIMVPVIAKEGIDGITVKACC
jgi:divalent metal cation (Fe/Co/Zn/Cd) transporter